MIAPPNYYRFGFTPDALGVGVSNRPLLRPQTLPWFDTVNGRGRHVLQQLTVLSGAPSFPQQKAEIVSLRGSGIAIQGQMALQALTDFEAQARKREA